MAELDSDPKKAAAKQAWNDALKALEEVCFVFVLFAFFALFLRDKRQVSGVINELVSNVSKRRHTFFFRCFFSLFFSFLFSPPLSLFLSLSFQSFAFACLSSSLLLLGVSPPFSLPFSSHLLPSEQLRGRGV